MPLNCIYNRLQTKHVPAGVRAAAAVGAARAQARDAAAPAAGRRGAAVLAAAGRLDRPQAGRYATAPYSPTTNCQMPNFVYTVPMKLILFNTGVRLTVRYEL